MMGEKGKAVANFDRIEKIGMRVEK